MRPIRLGPLLLSACLLVLLATIPASAGFHEHADAVHRYQLLPPGQVPGETYPTPPPDILSPVDDSDGDGIPNIQDPDDDNGGTSDEDDPAPFDPVIEPTPVPEILSPIDDSDGDGLPNIQDPDDDNDAVQDDEDAAPFMPGTEDPNPPVKQPSSNPARGGASDSGEPPVVTSLPVTGTGSGHGGWEIVGIVAAGGAVYVALGAIASRRLIRDR